MLQDCADFTKRSLRMAVSTQRMRKCHKSLDVALICLLAVCFQGVTCDTTDDWMDLESQVITNLSLMGEAYRGDGDNVPHKGGVQVQIMTFPSLGPDPETVKSEDSETTNPTQFITVKEFTDQRNTQAPDHPDSNTPAQSILTAKGGVVCVDDIPVQYRHTVLLKLKASSTCEETRVRIQSVLEHLCGEDCKLEIYQKDNTDEITVYGDSIEADPEGMAKKFNNDNITDKVEVEEAMSRTDQRSRVILISLLITGLLLAALLIAGYLLKTHRGQSKGLRLAEESFQVDTENQGNTLLSVAPLPQQEPLDKPTINGESLDSPPTNGHSANQTQVADTQM